MFSSNIPISLLDSTRIPALGCESHQPQVNSSGTDTVARAQAGSHDAFAELYSQHKRRVFSVCMRMVCDSSLAEDLTQETFLQVYRKIATFRGNSAFATWLHRLAVNTVLMHLRKRVLASVSLDHLMEDGSEDRVARSFGTRDLIQAGVVDRLTIDHAVATMAPGYRSIFLLHDIDGFDHGEIASQLKCSRGNIKSQLHKARRVVRGVFTTQAGHREAERGNQVKDSFPLQAQMGRPDRSARSSGALSS